MWNKNDKKNHENQASNLINQLHLGPENLQLVINFLFFNFFSINFLQAFASLFIEASMGIFAFKTKHGLFQMCILVGFL